MVDLELLFKTMKKIGISWRVRATNFQVTLKPNKLININEMESETKI